MLRRLGTIELAERRQKILRFLANERGNTYETKWQKRLGPAKKTDT